MSYGVEAAERLAGGRHRPAAVRVEAQLALGRRSRRAPRAPSRPPRPARRSPTLPSNAVGVVLLDHPRAVPRDLERASTRPAPTGRRGGARSTPSAPRACGRRRRAARTASRPSARPRASQSAISMPPNTRRSAPARRPTACSARGDAAALGLVQVEDVERRSAGRGAPATRPRGRRRRSRPDRRCPRRSRPRRPSSSATRSSRTRTGTARRSGMLTGVARRSAIFTPRTVADARCRAPEVDHDDDALVRTRAGDHRRCGARRSARRSRPASRRTATATRSSRATRASG